jgi:hypothetical protein
MSCTEVYTDLSRICKGLAKFQFRPYVKRDCNNADFHETRTCSTFLKEPFIKLHENPTNGLIDDTGQRRTDGLTDLISTLRVFLLTF